MQITIKATPTRRQIHSNHRGTTILFDDSQDTAPKGFVQLSVLRPMTDAATVTSGHADATVTIKIADLKRLVKSL